MKLQYLGHLIRCTTSQPQLIQGKIESRISHGQPRTTWITDLTNRTGAKKAAEDKTRWLRMVVNLAQETDIYTVF